MVWNEWQLRWSDGNAAQKAHTSDYHASSIGTTAAPSRWRVRTQDAGWQFKSSAPRGSRGGALSLQGQAAACLQQRRRGDGGGKRGGDQRREHE